ncbi:MAG TPA: DUF2760 domain-containing protein [Bryobacteraceae bacterium]|nr:DUF2760 domain-containing protein [Bryobacteraceae bacterium]
MNRILLAFRSFFNILFQGQLSESVQSGLGLSKRVPAAVSDLKTSTPPRAPTVKTSDGALQILAILQRDARLLDFLMEDLTAYSDDQVGAAVREMHDQCRDSLARYVKLQPVIDGVEGTFTQALSKDPNVVKFVGNVPATPPAGGTLRHKGWHAATIDLPPLAAGQDASILAPAELEVE